MRTGEAPAHARIVDETDGRVVPDAFFSPEDELWNQAQTRLTLLFDPGRIKRGLRPNEELSVSFGEPMDEALLERLLVIRDSRGAPVAGRVVVARGEERWQFVPAAHWRAGRYAVDVGTDLEDLAGNNLRRLFDTDLRDTNAPTLEHADRVSLPVIVRDYP